MPVLWWKRLFFPSDGQRYVRWGVLGCLWEAYLLTVGFVFLSSWLFGLGHPTLELAGSLVDLGLGVKVQTSERAHTN